MFPPFRRLTRRDFLKWSGAAATGLYASPTDTAAGASGLGEAGPDPSRASLPSGPAPEALAFPHFPSPIHAFVWRNWPVVPVERIAGVLRAHPSAVRGLARSMGLGLPPRIPADQQRRSYITVIKRNWHLLPYDQLLTLLGWNAAQLAFTLREDDFLWVKLGNLKPRCAPLRWPSERKAVALLHSQAERINAVVRQDFGHDFKGGWPRAFAFVEGLSAAPKGEPSPPSPNEALRFCYSYFALYGDPLLEPDLDPYPEGYLARLAQSGVTGVWLQGVLYQLARFPWQPALSTNHERRRDNLAALVSRARKHGIRVFLYLNEPRAMPIGFFTGHPQLKGVTEGDHATLCTSDPAVREYLTEAVATLCQAVPDLGGFFTITASENLTNCWSHGGGQACPRCGPRGPAEVIAEVNSALHEGITRADKGQRLIAWDWGWADGWAADAIDRLPKDVALMSVSEWSLPLNRGGVETVVGEYSLSAIGPGPRAQRHWALARKRGLQTIAKIQANNTWELSAIPYVPVAGNAASHAANLRQQGLDGIMLGWTLGGYPSPNLEAVATVMKGGRLEDVAQSRYGADLATAVLRAWREAGEAFAEFPYHISVVYSAPLQTGPSNLLWGKPTGYAASMVGFGYDQLNAWRGPFPPEVFARQLAKVADGFDRAAELLLTAIEAAEHAREDPRAAARQEATLARAAALHFRSVSHQARFVVLRDQLLKTPRIDRAERATVLEALRDVILDEITAARALFELQTRDARIGFEASNQYFYLPVDLAEKVLNCRYLLEDWLPAEQPHPQPGRADPNQPG